MFGEINLPSMNSDIVLISGNIETKTKIKYGKKGVKEIIKEKKLWIEKVKGIQKEKNQSEK